MAPLDKQGSGARRTLLWSALKIVSERKPPDTKKAKKGEKSEETELSPVPTRPHVLLLDEPEMCLHPAAIRDACRVLYDSAAQQSGWQVMGNGLILPRLSILHATTPLLFASSGEFRVKSLGATVFRPEKVNLTFDDKELLKLLNRWDPHVAEFFFSDRNSNCRRGHKFSAFREIIEGDNEKYNGVHIIRARGKYIIPIIVKILNHFGSPIRCFCMILTRLSRRLKQSIPAWSANERILHAVALAPDASKVRLAASVVDFENAMFGETATSDKPYRTVMKIRTEKFAKWQVSTLLDYLLFTTEDPPAGVIAWSNIAELASAVAAEGFRVETSKRSRLAPLNC